MTNEKALQVISEKREVSKPVDQAMQVSKWMEKNGRELQKALPKTGLTPERFARQVLTTLRQNPTLQQCDMASLVGAIMQTAQLGLEPNNLGHAYFVPFRKGDKMNVQLIIGYTGYLELINRSGKVSPIQVQAVYDNDKFRYWAEDGELKVYWEPWFMIGKEEPGNLRAVFMLCKTNLGNYVDVMPKLDIDKHRKASKTKYNSPWDTHYDEMAKKTIVRKNWKYLPISTEIIANAIGMDETVKTKLEEDMSMVEDEFVDVDFEVVDTEGGK